MHRRAALLLLGLVACTGELTGDQCLIGPRPPAALIWTGWAEDAPRGSGPPQGRPGTVSQTDPFVVAFDEGWSWTFPMEAPPIPFGARVDVELELIRFGLNDAGGRVALWALASDGARGPLAFAAWYGPDYMSQDFGDLRYRTEPDDTLLCGDCDKVYRKQRYRVAGPDLDERTLQDGDVGPYHFRAHAYDYERGGRAGCYDHVHGRLQAGRVARADLTFELATPPIDCTTLSVAACAQPECTLFGGDGLPDTCQRTLAGCERLDEVACTQDATCVWLSGVEGAPGLCRQACITENYGWGCSFGELRFCQALDSADEACGRGAPGFCQRRPPEAECWSTADTPVCGCGPEDPTWHTLDACWRAHQGNGYVRTATVCPQ
jgi:hypothetical protein